MASELHQRRAQEFYTRKRGARLRSKTDEKFHAITLDFSKNLCVPNITTNDVYYKRQLSVFLFNIHQLGSSESSFYLYDETVAKKGSCDVVSMIHDFILSQVPNSTDTFHVFCDSCGGQNKNYTVFRYYYYLVHIAKIFDTVKVTFPIRGHSYLECDRNFALVNDKAKVYIPSQWATEISQARKKPSPFSVHLCSQDMFKDFNSFLAPLYKAKCPFAIQKVREIQILRSKPREILHRDTYSGPWVSSIIVPPNQGGSQHLQLQPLYTAPLPLSSEKYKDLQHLKQFVEEQHHSFFNCLPHGNMENTDSDDDQEQ